MLLVAIVTGAKADYKDLSFTATKTVASGGEIWYPTSTNVATANTAGWCSKNENGSNNKYGNITPDLDGDVVEETPFQIDGVLVKGGNIPTNLTTSKKALVVKFTNATSVTIYGATTSSGSSDNAAVRISVYNVTDGAAVVSNQMSSYASPNNTAYTTVSNLDAGKVYIFCIDGGFKNNSTSNQDVVLYAVKFTAPAVEVAPSTPTFTVDGGAVTGATTTIIASENASKIYYAWTESATAPEKGDAAYTEQGGSSYEVTIPNVSGTKYLHAYGWNSYNTSSTSDIKSAEFTITKDVTAPKTWNFATDFSAETIEALATNFELKSSGRYESTAKITKGTDIELGEYAAPVWSGLIVGRTGNDISAGGLRIMPNGYIQINGGNGYYRILNLKDGDVVKVRCTSANQTDDRSFTVTGATETTATAYCTYKGYSEFTLTKSGNGQLVLKQGNGINVWTISVNEDLPALTTTTEGITIGTEGVATYVTNNAIDFSGVTGLTAYTATSANNQYVFTEAVTGIVPANTALLVRGASATIPLVQATSTSVATLEGNILKASDGNKTGGDNIYAFSKSALKFKKVDSEVTIPSGKAYLVIESGEAPTALDIQFDGEATAVEAIAEAQAETAAPVKVIKGGKLYIGNYNVAGQQVK